MDITTIILNAAKVAKVSGALLLAICSHESNNFTMNYAHNDKGSPSFGSCQLKENSARQMGFKGKAKDLMSPWVNAKYAALYLKYEQKRYGNDWVKLVASYNAGSYRESDIVLGCPRNLHYINLVRKKLPPKLQNKLNCGEMARNND
jgi:soluble lytic murein transglycosylase-like protein